ncbi:exported hypothetical protein [Tenacibaculum litopenaei]|uniref:hypothetical protein n=1 Tax=Tenacibaculum litopenaei TaxID=396016 RepID=UPI003894A27B
MKNNNLLLALSFLIFLSCSQNKSLINPAFFNAWKKNTQGFIKEFENEKCKKILNQKISEINFAFLREKALDTIFSKNRNFESEKMIVEESFFTNSPKYMLTLHSNSKYKVVFERDHITSFSKLKFNSDAFNKADIKYDHICNDSLIYSKEKASINISTFFVRKDNLYEVEKLEIW